MVSMSGSAIALLLFSPIAALAADPLPSWNDGPAKQSIVAFVDGATGSSAARPAAVEVSR
jgi:hypothetical protein